MNFSGEIFAFLVEDHFVCFDCYLPGKDEEDVILTRANLAEFGRLVCGRCNKRMDPDRRMINRRSGIDRRRLSAKILAPDRRRSRERRRRADRRSSPLMGHMAEHMASFSGGRAALPVEVEQ